MATLRLFAATGPGAAAPGAPASVDVVTAGEPLLDPINRARVPLGQSCRGEGVCQSCAVRVVLGADALTPPTALERRARGLDLDGGWRLACQAVTADDADADAVIALWHPAWGRPGPPGGAHGGP